MVWCDGNSHHPIVREVQEREEADEEEPKELPHRPFEADHGVHYQCII